MAGRIIQLSEARRIKEPPYIDTSIRADLGDYGPPGWHLHGPLAGAKLRIPTSGPASTRAGPDAPGDEDPRLECIGQGGYTIHEFEDVAAGVITILASSLHPFPFLISRLWWITNSADITNIGFRFFISSNTLTVDTDPERGQELTDPFHPNHDFRITSLNVPVEIFPNFLVRDINRAVKFRFGNLTAASVRFDAAVDILRLG